MDRPTAGEMLFRGATSPGPASAAAGARLSPRRADGVPGPVLLAQPGAHRRITIWRGRCALHRPAKGKAELARRRRRAARRGRARPGADRAQIPARAVGRPAPARQHRARAGRQAGGARRRRADLDARRVDPARHPRPARRHQARAQSGAALHHPRHRHRRAMSPKRSSSCLPARSSNGATPKP